MAAGDVHVADPLHTVHHKMDSMVTSHHVYYTDTNYIMGQA